MRLRTRFALALLLALASAQAQAEDLTGPAQVVDGDSLVVRGRQVRLSGIDAPEWDQTCTRAGKKWKCGAEAGAFLRSLVEGRVVSCAVEGLDKYKRALATCYLDGKDLNEAIVRAGWAVAYRRYSDRYVGAEEAAKAEKSGIWVGEFQGPEEFRREG